MTVRAGLLGWLFAASLLIPLGANAGPVQDFEKQLTGTYAHYRAALFLTNQNKKDETLAALAAFEKGWADILAQKTTPPPQYADDAKWPATLDEVSHVLHGAKGEAERGDLAKSHETLEAIRDLIGDLRLRNGMISFSDRMNAYHEQMEKVAGGNYDGEPGLAKLREDVAVLAFLANEVERFKPAAFAADPAFVQGLAALTASVAALQTAVRAGDTAKLGELRKAIKPPYSRLFLRYG